MKMLCDCGKIATWMYMPGDKNHIFCDDCVHRGCSCNEYCVEQEINGERFEEYPDKDSIEGKDWEWVIEDIRWRQLDNGKKLPCCEYFYDNKGFDYE